MGYSSRVNYVTQADPAGTYDLVRGEMSEESDGPYEKFDVAFQSMLALVMTLKDAERYGRGRP